MKNLALVVFEGGSPRTEVETMVADVRKGVVVDNITRFRTIPQIDRIVLYTNYADLACEVSHLGVEVELEKKSGPFHFSRELNRLVSLYNLEAILYLGGAAGSLLTPGEIQQVASRLKEENGVVIANNLFSSDIIGFTPARAACFEDAPETDNSLAMVLRDRVGLRFTAMKESTGTWFDVDTPADVAVLALCSHAGERVKAKLRQWGSCLSGVVARMITAKTILGTAFSEVGLIGRVSPSVMSYLNKNTQCRLRVFSEERGMKALGRITSKEVVSLLGFFLEAVGEECFFRHISNVCNVAFIDTRVLFGHLGLEPSRADRFNSDLGRVEEIYDSRVRAITEKSVVAPWPMVFGGHSLVSGGIRVLVDMNVEGCGI